MMLFERNKDIKETLKIGIRQTIIEIIEKYKKLGLPVRQTRAAIVRDIKDFTGCQDVYDISTYEYPYIVKFEFYRKDGSIEIIIVDFSDS